MKPPKIGSLVVLHRHPSHRSPAGNEMSKGYDTIPNECGYHKAMWVMPGLGIVVDRREKYNRIFIHERYVWFEDYQLDLVRQ